MGIELSLRFADPGHFIVRLERDGDSNETETLTFASPLEEADQQDLHWYLDVYAAHYTTDVDDERAARICRKAARLGRGTFQGCV